jgi:hypothetical protein
MNDAGGERRDYRRYTVTLPEAVEKEFRSPYDFWEINDIGFKGAMFEVGMIRSMFYYCFFFTAASKDVTPAMTSVHSILRIGHTESNNEMNDTNMARRRYKYNRDINDGRVSSRTPPRNFSRTPPRRTRTTKKNRSHRKKYYDDDEYDDNEELASSFGAMDIDSENSSLESGSRSSHKRGSTR